MKRDLRQYHNPARGCHCEQDLLILAGVGRIDEDIGITFYLSRQKILPVQSRAEVYHLFLGEKRRAEPLPLKNLCAFGSGDAGIPADIRAGLVAAKPVGSDKRDFAILFQCLELTLQFAVVDPEVIARTVRKIAPVAVRDTVEIVTYHPHVGFSPEIHYLSRECGGVPAAYRFRAVGRRIISYDYLEFRIGPLCEYRIESPGNGAFLIVCDYYY